MNYADRLRAICDMLEERRDRTYYKGEYGQGRLDGYDQCIDIIEDLIVLEES